MKNHGKIELEHEDTIDGDTMAILDERVEPSEIEVLEPTIPGPAQAGELVPANSYSETEKLKIISRIWETGKDILTVAREAGIAESTIHAWLNQYQDEKMAMEKFRSIKFAEMFGDKIHEFLKSVDKNKLDKATVKDLAIAVGIFTDKRQDLLGKQKNSQNIFLKVAWKDGQGAVEFTHGDQK